MDLLEHEGKQLFAAAGLPVLPSAVATTAAAAREAATGLGLPVVVKAQVESGGRGKAGGVRVCRDLDEVATAADEILTMTIGGRPVTGLLLEPAVDIELELYLAIAVSRAERAPVLIFSRHGGVDIEEIARNHFEAIVRRPLDPLLGPADYQVRDVLRAAALDGERRSPNGRPLKEVLAAIVRALWRLYHDRDATLVEINPLAVTTAGELICLDSKVTIDDNALGRQPELAESRRDSDVETRARNAGLAYVELEGDIGVLGNGAGLVMATMDQIETAGGAAANFCDIGGGAGAARVKVALSLITSSPRVAAVLVNVFGGITRCDEVARGLLEAFAETCLEVPVVVRLDGNVGDEGRAILAAGQVPGVTIAASPAEAVRLVVAAARDAAATPGAEV
ncbi:MAG: ADP-forming succinate--CoA ligase subunit beta [Thermoleophilia bacterium]